MPFAETSPIFKGQTYCFELGILVGEDSLVNQASLFHIEVSGQALIQQCNVNLSIMHICLHNCLSKPILLACTLRLVLLFFLRPSTITTYLDKKQQTDQRYRYPSSLHVIFASKNPQPTTTFDLSDFQSHVQLQCTSWCEYSFSVNPPRQTDRKLISNY